MDLNKTSIYSVDGDCCVSSALTTVSLQVIMEISQTWATMEFCYEDHIQTSLPLLRCDEDLIETLEDHQVHFF